MKCRNDLSFSCALVTDPRQTKGPGIARGEKNLKKTYEKNVKKIFKKFSIFLAYDTVTHEWPQTNSAQSVQPFGRLYATYIYIYECLVLVQGVPINMGIQ